MSADEGKRRAAERSLDFVENGMTLGLGTGSTAAHMVALLGARVRDGLDVRGVPTSEATRRLAEENGVPLTDLATVSRLDLTIDGADEFDPDLNLIKGGGGALLREKIVASLSDRMIVIADPSKRVAQLGAFALPVEVVPFAAAALRPRLERLGCTAALRGGDASPFITDEGNHILDCSFGTIAEPPALAAKIGAIPGVVEHGLFIGMAERAIIGGPDGVEEIPAPGTER
ncbi:MAG: ribose-5-phosphate isomerase RpiA [Minwuiales bacterium]|nr:ribose-5-phosphate isomerase RpiA [Minwuiales bacterium]